MSIPRWRYVRYTDDGSSLYQCLNCYNDWDARTAPGWDNPYQDVDEPCDGSNTIIQVIDGKEVPRHYIKLDVPVYNKTWTYCPYCGVEWEGPVRLENDNEYMYGPKRAERHRKVYERRSKDGWRYDDDTSLWWVIQERSVWRDDTAQAGNVGTWEDKEYAAVGKMPAAKMKYLLEEYQQRLDAEYNGDPHRFCDYSARLTTKRKKPGGYEVTNYKWPLDNPPECYRVQV